MCSNPAHMLQEVVIMSNACDTCGYRSSDIKAGGGVSDKGSHLILKVSEPDDLRRDVIKAESASISIPEADLEVTTGQACQACCMSSCMMLLDTVVFTSKLPATCICLRVDQHIRANQSGCNFASRQQSVVVVDKTPFEYALPYGSLREVLRLFLATSWTCACLAQDHGNYLVNRSKC